MKITRIGIDLGKSTFHVCATDRSGKVVLEIETCKMNGVEPYACLKSTLEKIAGGHPQ